MFFQKLNKHKPDEAVQQVSAPSMMSKLSVDKGDHGDIPEYHNSLNSSNPNLDTSSYRNSSLAASNSAKSSNALPVVEAVRNGPWRFKDKLKNEEFKKLNEFEVLLENDPKVRNMLLKLKRATDLTTLPELSLEMTVNDEMPKMKLFSHLEILTGLDVHEFNRLKDLIDKNFGYLTFKLFLCFMLVSDESLPQTDMFYFMQGSVMLFYHLCIETPTVQASIFARLQNDALTTIQDPNDAGSADKKPTSRRDRGPMNSVDTANRLALKNLFKAVVKPNKLKPVSGYLSIFKFTSKDNLAVKKPVPKPSQPTSLTDILGGDPKRLLGFFANQASIIKRGEKVISWHINQYLKDNLDNVILPLKEVSAFFLEFQRYGDSIAGVKEQIDTLNIDFARKKRILYTSSRDEQIPKLEVRTEFREKQISKKTYAVGIKCISYFARLDALIITKNTSSEILFVSAKSDRIMKRIDLTEVINSATCKITSITIDNDEACFFISTSDRAIVVVSLEFEDDQYFTEESKAQKYLENMEFKTSMFFTPELVLRMVYIHESDTLLAASQNHCLLIWYDVLKEQTKPIELRTTPRSARFTKFLADLNPNTLKVVLAYNWIVVADVKKTIWMIDPIKNEMIMQANTKAACHTILCDSQGGRIVSIGYEKNLWIYEMSKYFREVRSFCYQKAHVATIICGEVIPKRRIFITADEIGHVKSWDLDNIECIQNFHLRSTTMITAAIDIGYQGFIIMTTVLNYFYFEDISDRYALLDEELESIDQEETSTVDILTIPKIILRDCNEFTKEFMIATSSEVRSFSIEDARLVFRYIPERLVKVDDLYSPSEI